MGSWQVTCSIIGCLRLLVNKVHFIVDLDHGAHQPVGDF